MAEQPFLCVCCARYRTALSEYFQTCAECYDKCWGADGLPLNRPYGPCNVWRDDEAAGRCMYCGSTEHVADTHTEADDEADPASLRVSR